MRKVPSKAYDPADFSEEEAPKAWTKFFIWMHKATPIERPGHPFASHSRYWIVDDVLFGSAHVGLQTMECDARQTGIPLNRDFLFGWVFRGGCMYLTHNGEIFEIEPDSYCLIDNSREVYAVTTETDISCVVIPHRAIGYDPARHPSRLILPVGDVDEGALREDLIHTVRSAPDIQRRDAASIAARHKTLVKAALDRSTDQRVGKDPAPQHIKQFIDERILSFDLTPERVMKRFGLSRAHLHKHLDFPGRFDAYLLKRRLDYAFRSLVFGGRDAQWVGHVASSLGFSSEAVFSDQFEAQFGFRPEIVLGVLYGAKLARDIEDISSVWSSWLKQAMN